MADTTGDESRTADMHSAPQGLAPIDDDVTRDLTLTLTYTADDVRARVTIPSSTSSEDTLTPSYAVDRASASTFAQAGTPNAELLDGETDDGETAPMARQPVESRHGDGNGVGVFTFQIQAELEVLTWDDVQIDRSIKLGEGAQGRVCFAMLGHTNVAVKTMTESASVSAVKDFINEVTALARLAHPSVVQFLGAIIEPPELAIVTEYMNGGNLAELLRSPEPLSNQTKLNIAWSVACGLEYLHSKGIIHKDVKPGNVVLDLHMRFKLCDFGVSSLDEFDQRAAGTPRYAAPEIILRMPFTAAADIYSYGVTLFEVFADGRRAFTDENGNSQSRTEDLSLAPGSFHSAGLGGEIPTELEEVVVGAWAFDPRARPAVGQVIDVVAAAMKTPWAEQPLQAQHDRRTLWDSEDDDNDVDVYEAAADGDVDVVRKALNQGLDANVPNDSGFTLLHAAALGGSHDLVDLILNRGAHVNSRDAHSNTPLMYAAMSMRPRVLDLLLRYGADANARDTEGNSVVHTAAEAGSVAILEILSKYVPLDALNTHGQTPLHLAVEADHLGAAEFLLSRSVDVNTQDNRGVTPFHVATREELLAFYEPLITNGSDVNLQTLKGYAGAHWLAWKGNASFLRRLHALGADLDVATFDGLTPMTFAAMYGHFDATLFLSTVSPASV